ncbi:hypothetical protein C8R47DRAFT_1072788 [Mycena vitilis]|nr:hypothetical protein C8R47DRAFT_1072788 [Mycena vitilis]
MKQVLWHTINILEDKFIRARCKAGPPISEPVRLVADVRSQVRFNSGFTPLPGTAAFARYELMNTNVAKKVLAKKPNSRPPGKALPNPERVQRKQKTIVINFRVGEEFDWKERVSERARSKRDNPYTTVPMMGRDRLLLCLVVFLVRAQFDFECLNPWRCRASAKRARKADLSRRWFDFGMGFRILVDYAPNLPLAKENRIYSGGRARFDSGLGHELDQCHMYSFPYDITTTLVQAPVQSENDLERWGAPASDIRDLHVKAGTGSIPGWA